jgi:hypothetical protein
MRIAGIRFAQFSVLVKIHLAAKPIGYSGSPLLTFKIDLRVQAGKIER